MKRLESIINRLLSEAIGRNDIQTLEGRYLSKIYDAIDKRYEVKFRYNDGTDEPATLERRVQIVAYGISKAGNPVIRAYQPAGGSKRGAPAWKMFKLEGIIPNTWKVMHKPNGSIVRFDMPPGFNEEGDKLMSPCKKIADFKKAEKRRSTSYVAQKADYEKIRKQQDLLQRNLQNIANQKENPIVAKNLQNDTLHPDMEKYLRGEIPSPRPLKNNPALSDMERVAKKQDFGLGTTQRTITPAMKGKQAPSIPNDSHVDMKQAKKNGPYYQSTVDSQEDINKKEDNNTEDGQQ